jgi:hypothetical protein
MLRTALLGLAVEVLLIACGGGGSSGSLKYAPTVVPIKHLDLSDMEVTTADVTNPPLAEGYPDVVTTVNGEPVTSRALASKQALLELGRRQWTGEIAGPLQEQADAMLDRLQSLDPLEELIDDTLKRQAVERLGLLPSYEEAVDYTSEREEAFLHPRGTVSPENREETLETMRLQGFPTENWASDARVVEGYRQGMGFVRLRNEVCSKYETPAPIVTPHGFYSLPSSDCAGFLAQERETADIVYYVRWAD